LLEAAILGAGYMGSAMTFPLSKNNVQVNLWGTWLDNEIIKSCRNDYHPKLKRPLPENIRLWNSLDLKKAIENIDLAIIAVTSEGFLPVYSKLIDTLDYPLPFFALTKGLLEYNGKIERISMVAEKIFKAKFPNDDFIWASIGGPVKALELSDMIPTEAVYGTNSDYIKSLKPYFSTDYYRIFYTDDVTGVEASSAFKNVYSIAMGICDGLYDSGKMKLNHNLRAFIFNQSVQEMAHIVEYSGGKRETVLDLAGIGDLHVTSSSGRNRSYGALIGRGFEPDKAYIKMFNKGEIAEGYKALEKGMIYLKQLKIDNDFALFNRIYSMVYRKSDPMEELNTFKD